MKKNKYLITILILSSLLFLLLLIFRSSNIEKFRATTPITQEYDIIIVAGQSNALGSGVRNACDSTSLPDCPNINLRRDSSRSRAITSIANSYESTNPRIKQFSSEQISTRDTRASSNPNKIIDMREPLQTFYERTTSNVSFAFHFAKEYLSNTSMRSRQVLIVGCAWSGAAMFSQGNVFWEKPNNRNDLTNSLYNRTVRRLLNVKEQLASTNNSRVVAFLWHQGESNMTSTVRSQQNKNNYKSALKESLTGMRTEIMRIFNNSNSGYTFPILLGGLSYDKEFNRITGVRNTKENRQAMSEIVSEVSNPNDPNFISKSAFVSSDAITGTSFNKRLEGNTKMNAGNGKNLETDDNSHFSATANREFGKRYFFYYNQIK